MEVLARATGVTAQEILIHSRQDTLEAPAATVLQLALTAPLPPADTQATTSTPRAAAVPLMPIHMPLLAADLMDPRMVAALLTIPDLGP